MTEYTIYKLACNDREVTEIYVGSTKDWNTRLDRHRAKCTNPTDPAYNLKVYLFIRLHGGWTNWRMLHITTQILINDRHARELEQIYMDLLGSTLNSHRAYSTAEQIKATSVEYRVIHKDHRNAYNAVYRETHKEQAKATQAVYRETHKEQDKSTRAVYHKTHKEKRNAYSASYHAANRDKLNANKRARRLANKLKLISDSI